MLALYRCGRQAEALDVYHDARRALTEELGIEPGRELRDLQQAILRQDPALDPSAGEACARGAGTPALFVGRERELAELARALDDALAGRGRRRAGGRARHRQEPAGRRADGAARPRAARVLVGRCWEAGGAPAYWPWVQSLRAYLREGEPAGCGRSSATRRRSGASSLPELRELFPGLPEPPAPSPTGRGSACSRRSRSFLATRRGSGPLVLVLDDLHAADEPSLLLLRFLARELALRRLLVVGALPRRRSRRCGEPLTAALAELAREPHTADRLGGLSERRASPSTSSAATGIELRAPLVPRRPRRDRGQPAVRGGGRAAPATRRGASPSPAPHLASHRACGP